MSNTPDSPLALALRFLSQAERTEAELLRFLAKRGVEEEAARRTVELCVSRGYLTDRRAADREVEISRDRSKVGRAKLHAKLESRGVDPTDAAAAESAYTPEQEAENALAVLRQKKCTDPRKAVRLLVSRGYEEEAVRAAVESQFPGWPDESGGQDRS